MIMPKCVASFTDAWIETDKSEKSDKKEESHLLQMRGLKLETAIKGFDECLSHLLQMRGLKRDYM